MKKKPVNITLSDEDRTTAERLALEYGDGSISALFCRLVKEEYSREVPLGSGNVGTYAAPAVWTAVIGAIPSAIDGFRALAASQKVRDSFRKADAQPAAKSSASPAKRQAKSTSVAPPIQAALAGQKSLRSKRSSPLAAPPSAPSVRG